MKRRRFSNQQTRKIMTWEAAARLFLTVGLSAIGMGAYADVPSGIIGGENVSNTGGYAEFVFPNGKVSPISGLSGTDVILATSINEQGFALIGGEVAGNGYAAFVFPGGELSTLSSVPTDFPSGPVYSTAINNSGQGLIGGYAYYSMFYQDGYAATASVDGAYHNLGLSGLNSIISVALNGSGIGLIGGEGGSLYGYAAYVVNNIPSPISIRTGGSDYSIATVALNELGNGIVGGNFLNSGGGGATYAAFVTYNDGSPTASATITGIPGDFVNSVAINDSGLALIGGRDGSNAFAGYTTNGDSPSVSNIFDPFFEGAIYSVAINNAGTGLIGGQNASNNYYAAFVQPGGTVQEIALPSTAGGINSVAINQAGVGLIGGNGPSAAYAALVAPNGSLTELDVSNLNYIPSVALNNVTNAAVPKSAGSYLSSIYTQLAASAALESRFIEKNRIWNRKKGAQIAQANVADSEMLMASNEMDLAQNPKLSPRKKGAAAPVKQNSIWLAPFGDYVHLKAQGAIPNYTNEIGGALLGCDHQGADYMVGGTLGYAFNYIHYSNGLGHGKLQEEMASVYGVYQQDHFRFNGVLWGGVYQFWNTRHTLSIITSKAMTHGWILSPHIEMASPWAMDQKELYFVEPFFMLDWISSWQGGYTERGAAGFNLKMPSVYSSLLQSEVGLRFYEQFMYGWGSFQLEEKVSYINQAPFVSGSVSTSFVAAASSFPIAVASSKVENLAALEVMASFAPKDTSYPFGGITLQVTGNSSYQSYFASVFTGVDF